ncbi:GDYXXLXY domain-containing protein [Halobacillus kuroshimensis]|uniref:GDYXXLXY domain-containing protein n=1 Tax=Halobacillus kuroshimensis TaxID=302481 RepID=A0ABS3DQS2_9BACI|nr:GDYXXLXY domain-containing protein [Halobacillus sp. Cin3]MBN8233684.1 GDYXXLXY domain-containing protein [Halobacillus kuroshimensis]
MNKQRWFYGLVSVQVLFLLLMAGGYYAMDVVGEKVVLKTAPVDPRDPFYGDYVELGYDIEEISEDQWQGEKALDGGEKVFLLLEAGENGVYGLQKAGTERPDSEEGQVVLAARYLWEDERASIHHVDIGLNRYYIEENTGRMWEQDEERLVTIVLAPWNQKKIVSLD